MTAIEQQAKTDGEQYDAHVKDWRRNLQDQLFMRSWNNPTLWADQRLSRTA